MRSWRTRGNRERTSPLSSASTSASTTGLMIASQQSVCQSEKKAESETLRFFALRYGESLILLLALLRRRRRRRLLRLLLAGRSARGRRAAAGRACATARRRGAFALRLRSLLRGLLLGRG